MTEKDFFLDSSSSGVEIFVQNIRNRERHRLDSLTTDSRNLNTKTIIVQWNSYLDKLLRGYQTGKVCIKCRQTIPKITVLNNKIMTSRAVRSADGVTVNRLETVPVMPDQSKELLRKLWKNEKEVLVVLVPCLQVDIEHPTDVFFFNVIPVLPPIVRPVNVMSDQVLEHPQSQVYKAVLQDCMILNNIIQAMQDGDSSRLPDEGESSYF